MPYGAGTYGTKVGRPSKPKVKVMPKAKVKPKAKAKPRRRTKM